MKKEKQQWKYAPLPFQGQKRFFLTAFKKALKDFSGDATYVDLFGGSGLLSHTVKGVYPQAKVIYNDFDNFRQRLENIPKTNEILTQIRAVCASLPKGKKIEKEAWEAILNILQRADNEGFVDWVTLSASLLFSGKYATSFKEIKKETFYNNVRTANFASADTYLSGIEVVRMDYRELFNQYKYAPNTVFLVDPPYLSTDVTTYNKGTYWKLRDYLDVLETLHQANYFYFTSDKSQIVELCRWVETRTADNANPFKGAQCATTSNALNHNARYTDLMYWKKKS